MKRACITLDTEPDLHVGGCDIELFRSPDKLGALAEVINKFEVKLTGFLVTKILQRNAGLVETALSSLPIRFESHSHNHNPLDTDSARELEETVRWYTEFFRCPPKGYRAPNGLISPSGLSRLTEFGFVYDSSIFPSRRFDEFAYSHLGLPIQPYLYRTGRADLMELPMAVVPRIRLVISLSYLKLFGWALYRTLFATFGLPEVLIINTHPYDFFVESHLGRIPGWKRWAHARNAKAALALFERLLQTLQTAGYQFIYIDDLIHDLNKKAMTVVVLDDRRSGSPRKGNRRP